MRDPDRIPKLLTALADAWRANPDLRLAQLIVNACPPGAAPYNVEDDLVQAGLTAMAGPQESVAVGVREPTAAPGIDRGLTRSDLLDLLLTPGEQQRIFDEHARICTELTSGPVSAWPLHELCRGILAQAAERGFRINTLGAQLGAEACVIAKKDGVQHQACWTPEQSQAVVAREDKLPPGLMTADESLSLEAPAVQAEVKAHVAEFARRQNPSRRPDLLDRMQAEINELRARVAKLEAAGGSHD